MELLRLRQGKLIKSTVFEKCIFGVQNCHAQLTLNPIFYTGHWLSDYFWSHQSSYYPISNWCRHACAYPCRYFNVLLSRCWFRKLMYYASNDHQYWHILVIWTSFLSLFSAKIQVAIGSIMLAGELVLSLPQNVVNFVDSLPLLIYLGLVLN